MQLPRPTITSIEYDATALDYKLTGTQLTGVSEGTNGGDNVVNATNYPIIRIRDEYSGTIAYARTYNWDNTGVQTGDTLVHVHFTLPANYDASHGHQLTVIANGIPSTEVPFGVLNRQLFYNQSAYDNNTS